MHLQTSVQHSKRSMYSIFCTKLKNMEGIVRNRQVRFDLHLCLIYPYWFILYWYIMEIYMNEMLIKTNEM